MCFEILKVASDHLQAKLRSSLKEAIDNEEKQALNKSFVKSAPDPNQPAA